MTIKESLKKAIEILDNSKIEDSVLKSKILLSKIISKPKEYLFIYENEELSLEIEKEFFEKVEKLSKNMPLQYLTNIQEFMGLDFYVDENVLIPRNDTEILVEEVLKNIDKTKRIKILDMCTGSGIIAVTLAKYAENVEIIAVDKSEGALGVAMKNAKQNNVDNQIKFVKSDMFNEIKEQFDIIVSNPPYIESSIIETLNKDVQKEPLMALDGGEDGLEFYRIIAENTGKFLKEKGQVYLEIGYNQGESVAEIFEKKFENVKCIKDLSGLDRVIVAR